MYTNCSGSIDTLSFLPTVSGDDFVPDSTLNVTFSATPSDNPTDECASLLLRMTVILSVITILLLGLEP